MFSLTEPRPDPTRSTGLHAVSAEKASAAESRAKRRPNVPEPDETPNGTTVHPPSDPIGGDDASSRTTQLLTNSYPSSKIDEMMNPHLIFE